MKQITRKYHLFDARSKVLGRLSVEIARILSGRHHADFTPNIDGGDFVVVINVADIVVTGGKEKKKVYHRYTGYPGGLRTLRYEEVRDRDVKRVLEKSVFGMLPKNKLRAARMKRLLLFEGAEQPHTIHTTHE